MPDLHMKYLRTFLVLVEEKSTTTTASRLGMSQASILGHISKVEEVVGQPLLERRYSPNAAERGRTKLTEAGRVFLPKAIAAMRSHDQMFGGATVDYTSPEIDTAIAADLLRIASAALKHDLSDDDRKRIYTALNS